jgi:DNA polymerase-1
MVQVDQMLESNPPAGGATKDAYLLLQVHDELVYEIRTARSEELTAKIQEIMESVLSPEETREVPILVTVKSGLNWGDMKTT